MDGFTYNGVRCDEMNVWYVPDAEDNWFASPDFSVEEEEVNGRNGGYYYGNRVKIRTFSLKCFYEDVTLKERERIRAWLDRKTSGDLVFDERPFAVYHVRPTRVVPGKRYRTDTLMDAPKYSGTFTVTFSAYEPFGMLKEKYYTDYDLDGASQCCGILEKDDMPPAPTTSGTGFLMYNCGTEECAMLLEIGGTAASGVTITNLTNGTFCAFSSLPVTGYLEVDSRFGSIYWVHGTARDLLFTNHDDGYLKLAPYGELLEDVLVNYTSGSSTVELVYEPVKPAMVGKFMQVDGSWRKITAIDAENNTVTVGTAPSTTLSSGKAKITTMNE